MRKAGSPCRALTETVRLKEQASGSSLLPDLLVFCRRPPVGATYLTDATLIVEVMSKGIQGRDREEKWAIYQTLPSLRHYVLITRDSPHIETINRDGDSWSAYQIVKGLDATLALPSLALTIPLADIYADVFA